VQYSTLIIYLKLPFIHVIRTHEWSVLPQRRWNLYYYSIC